MDLAYEVLILAGKKSCIYDASKGNLLIEYNVGFQDRKKPFTPKTLALLNDHFMIGAVDKYLRVWKINGHESKNQVVSLVPGIVSVLITSSCGSYCVAAIQNCIYVWQVNSGKLLSKVSLNEQDVTCLKFTSDSSLLVIGYKSGHVITCVLSQLIGVQYDKKRVNTYYKWNHHAAEVTDIYTGCLGVSSRVATASLDMTCKLYELETGNLLTTICLDVPLVAVVMDSLENFIFLGDDCGNVYKINLFERIPRELHYTEELVTKVKGHKSRVLSLSISLEGNIFMSAGEDFCKLWDIESMACMSQINSSREDGVITNAFLAMKPPGLSEKRIDPPFSVPVFERNYESGDSENGGLQRMKIQESSCQKLSLMHEFSADKFYSSQLLSGQVSSCSSEAVHPTISENMFLESLHGEDISELRAVNNQLYSYMVNHSLDKLPHFSSMEE